MATSGLVVLWVRGTPNFSHVVGIYILYFSPHGSNAQLWLLGTLGAVLTYYAACDNMEAVSRVPTERTQCQEGVVNLVQCTVGAVGQSQGPQERNRHVE